MKLTENLLWVLEKMKFQILQNYILHMKFSKFCLCFHNAKFDVYFLGTLWEIFFVVTCTTDD